MVIKSVSIFRLLLYFVIYIQDVWFFCNLGSSEKKSGRILLGSKNPHYIHDVTTLYFLRYFCNIKPFNLNKNVNFSIFTQICFNTFFFKCSSKNKLLNFLTLLTCKKN